MIILSEFYQDFLLKSLIIDLKFSRGVARRGWGVQRICHRKFTRNPIQRGVKVKLRGAEVHIKGTQNFSLVPSDKYLCYATEVLSK